MRRKPLNFLLIGIAVTFVFLGICSYSAQGEESKEIYQQIEEALSSPWGDVAERLAEIGKPAVPVLLDILRSGEYKFPATIIEALGMIGDERAIPLLLEMLESSLAKNVANSFLVRALGRIGDPRAENIMLRIFEHTKYDGRLIAAPVLLKVGGKESREKVRQFVATTHHLQKRAWFWLDDDAIKELRRTGVDYASSKGVRAIANLIVGLKDVDLLTSIMRFGGWRKAECEALAKIGTPEAIEVLFKAAENDPSMWVPNILPGATESKRRELQQVNPYTRASAVEALLTIPGVDLRRVRRAFEDIPVEKLRVIPLTVKLQPDKWNIQWKKEHAGKGLINLYLGNLPGYSLNDIKPETIRLNGKLPIEGRAKILDHHEGFLGNVLMVKFNKVEAIKTIEGIWPGKLSSITITGELKDGKLFKGTGRIQIIGKK